MLAYFARPGTSNRPTEAINGRLEHLRGSALGFRNLTNYIARSLLESGAFRPRLHPDCEEPHKSRLPPREKPRATDSQEGRWQQPGSFQGVLLGTQGGEVRFEFPDLEAGQPAMLL